MLRLNHVTFACDEPQRVAEFWAALLGYEAEDRGHSWAASDPAHGGVGLFFNKMAKSPTIEIPIHLDVNVPDRDAEVERALDLGAKLVEKKTIEAGELTETFTVLRDPEGNGFCIQPDQRKPHPYIRNVTFACSEPRRIVAPFWESALGWPREEVGDEFVEKLRAARVDVDREFYAYDAIVNPDGRGLRLFFQRRQKSPAESYPIHLDFKTEDREAEIDRLTAVGATVVETKTAGDTTWTVMRDPEGNPFCVE
jgi:predicted enzyme related to lactoylglutathione lyase